MSIWHSLKGKESETSDETDDDPQVEEEINVESNLDFNIESEIESSRESCNFCGEVFEDIDDLIDDIGETLWMNFILTTRSTWSFFICDLPSSLICNIVSVSLLWLKFNDNIYNIYI